MMPEQKTVRCDAWSDESTVTITANTAQGIAELRRFAETADRPGESRFLNANIHGARQSTGEPS